VLRTATATHDTLYGAARLPVVEIGPSTVRPVKHEAWTDVGRFVFPRAVPPSRRALHSAPWGE
jgi:hypothetical protein